MVVANNASETAINQIPPFGAVTERNIVKTYMIRNIPLDLYRQVQHAAIDRGLTIGAYIMLALREFLKTDMKGE